MKIVAIPGLYKNTDQWAFSAGIFRPKVYRDPLVEIHPGGNALMIHEATHVQEMHAFWGCVVLLLTLGLGYRWWRKRCELRADYNALTLMGVHQFKAMLYMHPHPNTRWGKHLYGKTRGARFERTIKYAKRRAG